MTELAWPTGITFTETQLFAFQNRGSIVLRFINLIMTFLATKLDKEINKLPAYPVGASSISKIKSFWFAFLLLEISWLNSS